MFFLENIKKCKLYNVIAIHIYVLFESLLYFMDLCAVIMHFIGTLYAVCVQFIIICSLYAVLKTAYKLHVVLGKLHVVFMQL